MNPRGLLPHPRVGLAGGEEVSSGGSAFGGENKDPLGEYGCVALAAARSAAFDDAMRLWRKRANLDFSYLWGLKEMADAGLRHRLMDFYREAKVRAPDSWVPDHAIALLRHTYRHDR